MGAKTSKTANRKQAKLLIQEDVESVSKRAIKIVLDLAAERNWNKSDLAREMKVLPQNVTNWISRGLPPDQYVLAADLFNVSVDEVIGRVQRGAGLIKHCAHEDIPIRRIDLIRMYGRLPAEVRQPIRSLIETLSYLNHQNKSDYVRRVEGVTLSAVQKVTKGQESA